jgi:hypothetical protein
MQQLVGGRIYSLRIDGLDAAMREFAHMDRFVS